MSRTFVFLQGFFLICRHIRAPFAISMGTGKAEVRYMLIFTAKLNKKRLLAIVIIAAFVLAAIILSVPNKKEASATMVPEKVAVKGIKSNEDRVEFANALGYEVAGDPVRSQEVMIPSEFDEVYEDYNGLQKECGFDLEKYQGKRLMLYTYTVTNYPGEPEAMMDLLVYKNKIVGGAVYSAALDGFMHGLQPAE